MAQPLTSREALAIVEEWLALDHVTVIAPGPRHLELLERVVDEGQARGALIMDAHLAALALEYGLTLCSHDRDFARFASLRLVDPLRPAETIHER